MNAGTNLKFDWTQQFGTGTKCEIIGLLKIVNSLLPVRLVELINGWEHVTRLIVWNAEDVGRCDSSFSKTWSLDFFFYARKIHVSLKYMSYILK